MVGRLTTRGAERPRDGRDAFPGAWCPEGPPRPSRTLSGPRRAIPAGGARSDAAEALANAVFGVAVSWSLTWLVLGYSPEEAMGVTAMFFVASTLRAYVLRRIFRASEKGGVARNP